MQTDQVRRFYTDDSAAYDERCQKKGGKSTDLSQKRIVTSLTRDWVDHKVLEVGCGSGRFSVLLAKENPQMVLLDLSDAMLQSTLDKIGRTHKGLNASIYQIPLPSCSVEDVLSINVFNHIEDLPAALHEVNRVLAIGGEFVVNITNLYSWFLPAGLIVNQKKKSIGRDVFSKWLKPRKFVQLLEKQGFRVEESCGNVFVPISLDRPVLREALIFMDKLSTYSFLKYLAPAIFYKCRKTRDLA
jgi:ubiquinone/menaquinone biosynthesis C-methylase UbiE